VLHFVGHLQAGELGVEQASPDDPALLLLDLLVQSLLRPGEIAIDADQVETPFGGGELATQTLLGHGVDPGAFV
jgi:hypothetical protein